MKLQIPRLSKEEMRNIVRLRLAKEVMFSDEVSPDLVGIVFMPLAMGALQPPRKSSSNLSVRSIPLKP